MNRYEGNSPIKVTVALQLPIGAIGFITWLVFLIIKLTSNPAWLTWFWVWFPFWLPLAILWANIVIILIVASILAAIDCQHMSIVERAEKGSMSNGNVISTDFGYVEDLFNELLSKGDFK